MSRWLHLGCMECREDIPIGKTHWEKPVDPPEVMRFLMRHLGHQLVAADDGSDLFLDFVGEIPWDSPTPVPPRYRPEMKST
jgi:hypothetical protein